MPDERRYKDYKIYCCFVLNRLVSELGITYPEAIQLAEHL